MRTLLVVGSLFLATESFAAPDGPPGGPEFEHLIPHVTEACALVRENPGIFPFRCFPYGPLGLEVRKAKSSAEADRIRNFFLGVVGGACGIPPDQITANFFCGPECPAIRRDHLVQQLPAVRALAAAFEGLRAVRLLAVWAPKGELRVNDVFVMNHQAREAIPSATLGFVPSGDWKSWTSLHDYLDSIQVREETVLDLSRQMLAIGLSALIREASRMRLVGVGIGDNESGLIVQSPSDATPKVGAIWPDGRRCTVVDRVAPGIYYYETT